MAWAVQYHEDFIKELGDESPTIRTSVVAAVEMLINFGPQLGRPYVDTLKGSHYPNMKELRITVPSGEWRVSFAFDPQRRAILLTGGSKSGTSSERFYERLIRVSDRRYANHLAKLLLERKI
jgi:hypothetical protein